MLVSVRLLLVTRMGVFMGAVIPGLMLMVVDVGTGSVAVLMLMLVRMGMLMVMGVRMAVGQTLMGV
jgi:hypothetical protein